MHFINWDQNLKNLDSRYIICQDTKLVGSACSWLYIFMEWQLEFSNKNKQARKWKEEKRNKKRKIDQQSSQPSEKKKQRNRLPPQPISGACCSTHYHLTTHHRHNTSLSPHSIPMAVWCLTCSMNNVYAHIHLGSSLSLWRKHNLSSCMRHKWVSSVFESLWPISHHSQSATSTLPNNYAVDSCCTGMNVKVWNTRNKDQVPQEKP